MFEVSIVTAFAERAFAMIENIENAFRFQNFKIRALASFIHLITKLK